MELQKGRPADTAGRLEKEIRTYDLLDRLAGDPVFGLSRSELEQLMERWTYLEGIAEEQE